MLFPYFLSYSGSDFLVGILRSSIFIFSIGISIIGTKLSTRLKNIKVNLVLAYIFSYPVWFGSIFIFTLLIPATGTFNLLGFVIILFLGAIATIPLSVMTILDKKLQSVIIPSEIRTSLYSVVPTFASIFSFLFSFVGGYILEIQGFHAALGCILLLLISGLIIASRGLKKIKSIS